MYEHPEWHQPLFEALESKNISYVKIDLKKGSYDYDDIPDTNIYYNMVSPSAYVRGNQRAIPFAYALCKSLEYQNKVVVNGTKSMSLEFSKSSQIALLKSLKIDHPKSIVFNDVESLNKYSKLVIWPMVLKPEQGGSGAKMYLINNFEELRELFKNNPDLWHPDNLFLLQEKLDYDESIGIIRLEFIGERLLYAMRVITHGVFNLCPSVICNPEDGSDGTCQIVYEPQKKKPEFIAYTEVSNEVVETARKIMKASGHLVGSVEYIETINGRQVFYDINANSNLRSSIAEQFGINPFDEIVNYLIQRGNENK